jgi:hypothetical protein
MNNRQAIRSALKAMLSGETTAGANVFTNRETRLWQSELPAILIYTNQEPSTPESLSARRYIRNLELVIHVKIEATENVDDDLDQIVTEVEEIIDADQSLQGTVLATSQTNTEIRVDSDGEKDIGIAIITFECKYIS